MKKIAQLINEPIERAEAAYVEEHTGYAIGGVSPVGFSFEYPTLVDQDLMNYDVVWAAAGTHNAVFRLRPLDLVRITHGSVADIKK